MLTLTRTITGLNGYVLMEDGELTSAGERVFTEGDCWALAWALADLLGRPEALFTLGEAGHWTHVVVQLDDDLYLDGMGIWTSEQLKKEWHRSLVPVPFGASTTLEAYMDYLGEDFFVYEDYINNELVFQVAEAILARPEVTEFTDFF